MTNDISPADNDNTSWIGIDVAKSTFVAAYLLPGFSYGQIPFQSIKTKEFPRTKSGVQQLLSWLDDQTSGATQEVKMRVVMEATGNYSTELTMLIRAVRCALQPAIANPKLTSAFIKSLGLRNKTDGLEARGLAIYGAQRNPAAYQPDPPQLAALRALSRYRGSLVRQRVAETNRSRESVDSALVKKMQNRRIAQIKRDIQRVEQEIKAIIEQTPELKRDVSQLISIKGVSLITAVVILSEFGDLRRFTKARKLTAFAGLSPGVHQSGSSINRPTHLCKMGNSHVRRILFMSALSAIRCPGALKTFYQKLVDGGKPKMVALASVMRKLLTVMRAMLISGEPYNPQYISRNLC